MRGRSTYRVYSLVLVIGLVLGGRGQVTTATEIFPLTMPGHATDRLGGTPETEAWMLLRVIGFGAVASLAYSPDGRRMAVLGSGVIHILQTASEAVERQIPIPQGRSSSSVNWVSAGRGRGTLRLKSGMQKPGR
jgi:hypothetical protein